MAIHRTYIVRTPNTGSGNVDIILQGVPGETTNPVGISTRPVGGSTFAGTKVSAPAGWVGEPNGAFYEWRGRPVRFERLFGATGFTPRFRLGWKAVAYAPIDGPLAGLTPSRSLTGDIVMGGLGTVLTLADPSYGPVLRLESDNLAQLFIVHLDIFEMKDEDRDPSGT